MINQPDIIHRTSDIEHSLELRISKQQLERELHADLRYLKSKAVRLVDKLIITQSTIMRTRARLQRLTK